MRKLYLLLIMGVMAMVGFEAAAAALTLTVKVNDPSLVRVYGYHYSIGNLDDVVFDENNEGTLEFPDEVSTQMYQATIKIVPVTPEGSDPVYLTRYKLTDSDGVNLSERTMTQSTIYSIGSINQLAKADGGTLEIECKSLPNMKLSVNLIGDPAKVNMNASGTTVSLKAGEQEIELAPTVTNITIKPVGVHSLYYAGYNDNPLPLKSQGDEGTVTYYYSISNPEDGDRIEIETDYPDNTYTFNIECNDPAFIKEVYVNDYPQDSWDSLQVKEGDFIYVKGDSYNYNVVSCGINRDIWDDPSYEMSVLVQEDVTFKFEVTKIERDKKFVIALPEGVTATLMNMAYKTLDIPSGYSVVPFSDEESMVMIQTDLENFDYSGFENPDDMAGYWFVNEEYDPEQAMVYFQNTVADNDVIRYLIADKEPVQHNVTFTLEGVEGTPVIKKDLIIDVTDLEAELKAYAGTRFDITPAEGQSIKTVTVNGDEVAPVNGTYSISVPDADCAVVISNKVKPRNITIKCNIPAGLMARYSYDYDLDSSEEGTVTDLNYFDDVMEDVLQIAGAENYYISSALYNGEEMVGNEDYDFGGQFILYNLENNDVFDITVAKIERNRTLTLYVSGSEFSRGCYLAEKTRNIALVENIVDGYQTAMFADQDVPLLFGNFGVTDSTYDVYVFNNDETVVNDFGYNINCEDGDVMKVYFATEKPLPFSLEYTIEGLENTPVVKHDLVTAIDEPSTHNVLPGTHVSIAASDEIKQVRVNDEPIQAEEGEYGFNVDKDTKVFVSGSESGVDSFIIDEEAASEVYNLQGIRVNGDVKNLPAGVYIINGRKVVK